MLIGSWRAITFRLTLQQAISSALRENAGYVTKSTSAKLTSTARQPALDAQNAGVMLRIIREAVLNAIARQRQRNRRMRHRAGWHHSLYSR